MRLRGEEVLQVAQYHQTTFVLPGLRQIELLHLQGRHRLLHKDHGGRQDFHSTRCIVLHLGLVNQTEGIRSREAIQLLLD